MLEYQIFLQKSAIAATNPSTGEISRQEVYYPSIVGLQGVNTRWMVKNIMANGNSAFTPGEMNGVIEDLGSSLAYAVKDGKKVLINGLGTFEPTLITDQKNMKDPSKITKSHFSVGIKFTPDDEFMLDLNQEVDWKRKSAEAASASATNSIRLTQAVQNGSGNLKFVAAPAAVMTAWTTNGITAKVNGTAHNDISVSASGLFLNNVIAAGATLTNATIFIHLPNVTVGEDAEAVTYIGGDFTINGVTQTGEAQNADSDDGLGG